MTVRIERHRRGPIGHILKWLFILFNLGMIVWVLSYWVDIGHMSQNASSEAAQAGTAIGATIGTGMLMFVWVFGVIILGALTYFSRGPKVITEEEG